MEFQVGQIVKFAQPVGSDEAAARFKVLELRGPRVLLEMAGDEFVNWSLKPTTVHLVADMTAESL